MTDDIRLEAVKSQIAIIREIGFFGYKTLITLNSGAFIVILTFIGNMDSSSEVSIRYCSIKLALWSFLAGIGLTVVATTIAYLSAQLSLIGRNLPLGRGAFGHVIWLLLPVLLSFLAFLIGAAFAITGISI